jgi:uracil-DNA glycosylase
MSDSTDPVRLARAARQLVETDVMLGGAFLHRKKGQDGSGPFTGSPMASACAAAPDFTAASADKAAVLAAMDENEVRGCIKCCLSQGRTQTVFGEGSPDAELVFVGEGPGEEEDKTGRPFVGRAGELLTKMIQAMGLSRQQVFIANMVKCRPPGNRAPAPEEIQACWSYLVRQLQTIQPKVIVTLGNPATQGLLNTRVGITRLRGQWQKLPDIGAGLAGIDVMPTFHPAYVLRQYTPENRQKVWSDLQKVMDALGLPRREP